MSAALHREELEVQDAFASDIAFEREPSFVARLGAEVFGSFLLVFVGVGLAVYAVELNVGALGVTLGIGLALMAGLATVGHVSGHFNPAVTLGSAMAGRTAWLDVLPLWLSQLVGGAIAAGALFFTIPASVFGSGKFLDSSRALMGRAANGFDTHAPLHSAPKAEFYEQFLGQGATLGQISDAVNAGELVLPAWPTVPLVSALFIEVIATALFVGIFLAVTGKIVRSVNTPLVVGLAFTMLLLVTTPFTNGGLNPARSFASALFAQPWALGQLWLFFAAPLLGAAIAGLVYRLAIVPTAPLETSDAYDDTPVEVNEEDIPLVEETVNANDVVVEEEGDDTTKSPYGPGSDDERPSSGFSTPL